MPCCRVSKIFPPRKYCCPRWKLPSSTISRISCSVIAGIVFIPSHLRSAYYGILLRYITINEQRMQLLKGNDEHLERMPVTLSAAKGLARRTQRSFAALRMTARTLLRMTARTLLRMTARTLLRMTARTALKYCHPEPMRCAQGKLCAGPLTGSLLAKRLVVYVSDLKVSVKESDPGQFSVVQIFCPLRTKWSAHKLLPEDNQGIIGRNGISWRRDGHRLVELA